MHGSKRVSVVLPAFNEAPYIRSAVEDFSIPAVVDEIVVVDNNKIVEGTFPGKGLKATNQPGAAAR